MALQEDRQLEFETVAVMVAGEAQPATAEALAWTGGRESHRLEDIEGCG